MNEKAKTELAIYHYRLILTNPELLMQFCQMCQLEIEDAIEEIDRRIEKLKRSTNENSKT